MRKSGLFAAAAGLLLGAILLTSWTRSAARAEIVALTSNGGQKSNLPAVFKPPLTPTPTTTPSPTREPVGTVTPPPTVTPVASPTPGFGPNWLKNGSFENGWTDLPPVPGNLINQEPRDWELSWLAIGEEVWDLRTIHPEDPAVGIVSGIAEMIHKLLKQLPEDERPGQPNALILEGEATYKMFHRGASFGSQLYQEVTLPAGKWRLTAPLQLHWHEDLDPNDPTWDTFTAESGVWVVVNGQAIGNWATARDMGDRRWFYHVVEFTLPAETEVGVLIRVKSIYKSPKDFFVDAVWLEPID